VKENIDENVQQNAWIQGNACSVVTVVGGVLLNISSGPVLLPSGQEGLGG
jgi:hypothetical protein